jgi:hypothetical protein
VLPVRSSPPAVRGALDHASQGLEQPALLQQDEAEHRQSEDSKTGAEPEQPRAAALGREQQHEAQQDEGELRRQSDCHIHHDACARKRAGDTGAGQEVRADDVAPDLSNRKQAVDRAADPALYQHCPKTGAFRRP